MTAIHGHSLKERQRQERERLILRTAEELLLEKGYHETSIDDIAAHVGISKGTIYLHFASKEDLVLALFERGRRDFVSALDVIVASEQAPGEKLQAIIRQMYSGLSGQRFQLLSAMFSSPELCGRLFEKRDTHAGFWDEPMRRIATVIEQGKACGEFDTSLPTVVMLTALGGLLSLHGYHRLVVSEGMTLDDVIGSLSRFYLKGIATCPRSVERQKVERHVERQNGDTRA